MSIHTRTEDHVLILEPQIERLDIHTVPSFREEANSLLVPECRIVIHMQQMTFVDSTGLGALLSLLRKVKEMGGEMVLACPSDQTLAMFRLVKMNRVFDIYPDCREAVAALGA